MITRLPFRLGSSHTWQALVAVPCALVILAVQAQENPGAATAAPQAEAPSLRLAHKLTPLSLSDNASRNQLLEALNAMLSEHPDVLKARSTLDSARYDVNTAKGARWPSFKVGTSYGNASLGQNRERQSYNAINAEVRMNLLDGGAIDAGIRSAEEMESAQDSVLFGTRQNVLLDALTALLELHRFDAKVRIAAESASVIGQLAHVEERRAELGAVGRNDLRRAASRQSSALAQQHALESQRMDALARFTRFYNYTPISNTLPDLQVPARWMPASEEAAKVSSESQSAELTEIAHMIERATAEVERSKAQRFPTLAAVVAHTRDPKGVLYNEGTRYGLELNWNIGNGFELRDRILKSISELQAQEAQQESVRRQVHEAASAAWGRTQAGRQRETQLTDAVREARSAFEGYRRLLEVGRGNLSLVLDAQLDMQRLMLDEADAIYDQRINELRLVRTTGQLLPKDMPEQWLSQLFDRPLDQPAARRGTQGVPSALPLRQAKLAVASTDLPPGQTPLSTSLPLLSTQRAQLRLEKKLDSTLFALPRSTPESMAVRW
ncbi:MAG: TolC family protein [Ottowia sp.]|uniref:TolC family protein n=1 Tax=Ottowia sp. TaxID=1898956 RepID=UPI003C73FABF